MSGPTAYRAGIEHGPGHHSATLTKALDHLDMYIDDKEPAPEPSRNHDLDVLKVEAAMAKIRHATEDCPKASERKKKRKGAGWQPK